MIGINDVVGFDPAVFTLMPGVNSFVSYGGITNTVILGGMFNTVLAGGMVDIVQRWQVRVCCCWWYVPRSRRLAV